MASAMAFILIALSALSLFMLTILFRHWAGGLLADAGWRWRDFLWTLRADAAERKQERRRRYRAYAYRWQAERAKQRFRREFDDEVERELRQQEGALGAGVDDNIVRKAEEAKQQRAMFEMIRQRTVGCCNLIVTARETTGPPYRDPADHPLCRKAQARVLHYLDRFHEHLYTSSLIDEDPAVAQAALVLEGARRVCASCPLRNPRVANPEIPCETVKAFSNVQPEAPAQDFYDGPVT